MSAGRRDRSFTYPDSLIRLLGFKWRPSYKSLWHWLNVRVKAEGLIVIHEALMRAIGAYTRVQNGVTEGLTSLAGIK